jgi:uroporphyrin-III C-methyltransferase
MTNKNHRKVYLVGAGSGDPELITIKGLRLLQNADVIVYDRLVNPILLYLTPPQAKLVYVGKSPDLHIKSQTEIGNLLVELAKSGQSVVRLKGGDPAIFGRVGEEMTHLQSEGVAYEVVPGITAASSVSIYAAIPITQRQVAERVLIMTPREILDDFSELDLIKTLKSTTLVLYMGVGALPDVIEVMKNQGVSPEMALAIVENGTQAKQRTLLTTLKTITDDLVKQPPKNPALIIIGQAVKLAPDISWFQDLPRFGQRILLVRTTAPEMTDISAFTSQGADVWVTIIGDKRQERFDTLDTIKLSEPFDQIIFQEGTQPKELEKLKERLAICTKKPILPKESFL